MNRIKVAVALVFSGLACAPVWAGDPLAGKSRFAVCAGCHGPAGMGNAALGYPRLAGLDAGYVAAQLRAFRSGSRKSATMEAMVAGLTEADIDNLAAHIATLR